MHLQGDIGTTLQDYQSSDTDSWWPYRVCVVSVCTARVCMASVCVASVAGVESVAGVVLSDDRIYVTPTAWASPSLNATCESVMLGHQ